MSTGAFEGDDRFGPPETESSGQGQKREGPGEDHELLDEVLEETLAGGGDSEPVRPEEIQALVDVVRRYGSPMNEAGVLDLVRCLLAMRFARFSKNDVHWDKVATGITRVLLDDTPSETRLRRFWNRLSEAAR